MENRRIKQIVIGILVLVATVIMVVVIDRNATCAQDRDASFALITVPLGLYMIFGKTIIIM